MKSSPPKYLQIKVFLSQSMADGRIEGRVPSENELAREHHVSRMTARKALNELLRDGLVERISGKGTFVKKRPATHAFFHIHAFARIAKRCGIKVRSQVIRSAIEDMPETLKAKLPGNRAICIRRVHFLGDQPVCYEIRFLRKDWCAPLLDEDLAVESVHSLILGKLGLPISRVWQRLEAVILEAAIAGELGTPANAPAFCMKQLIYSANDPVSYVDYFLRSDGYAFENTFEPGNLQSDGWAGSGWFAPAL